MAKTYAVRLMNKQEWATLLANPPCPHVDEDSAGYADPKTQTAYVKATKSADLNRYLINHEFEHLLEEEGTDECPCGMRHKKQSNWIQKIFAPATLGLSLPTVREALSSAIPDVIQRPLAAVNPFAGLATNSYNDPSTGKLNKGSLGKATLTGVGASLPFLLPAAGIGATGVAAKSAMAAGRGTLAQSGPVTGASASRLGTGIKSAGRLFNIFGGGQGSAATAPAAGPATSTARGGGFNLFNLFRPGTASAATAAGPAGAPGALTTLGSLQAPAQAASQPGFFSQAGKFLGSPLGKELLGTGIGLLGEKMVKTPEVPDLTSSEAFLAAQNRALRGIPGTDIGRLAQTRLSEQLQQPFTGLDPTIESSIRNTYNRRRSEVSSQFKAFRPGADLATDSAFRQAMQDVDREESEVLAQTKQQELARFETGRRSDIAQALGIDESTMGQLMELAQMDAAQIALQAGVDFETARQFKSLFSNIGAQFVQSGLGLASPFGNFTPQTAGAP